MSYLRSAFDLVKAAGQDFMDDECTTNGAAIAYYAVFSLPPLLAVLVAVAGWAFGQEAVTGQLAAQVEGLIGPKAAEGVQEMIASAGSGGADNVWATVLGAVTLLFGASGAFGQLQTALNRAWEVRPDPAEGGLRQFIGKRVLSFGMVLTLAFLLVVSLGASALLTAFGGALEDAVGGGAVALLIRAANVVLSLGLIGLLFAALFRVLPDAEVAWRDVWVGAGITALLFTVGKWAIGFYLGTSDPGSAFGAAGSLAVILVWIYYTSLILLFGAEFTQVWASRYGSGIAPDEDAVRIVEQERIVERGTAADDPAAAKDDDRPVGATDTEAAAAPAVHPWAEPRAPKPFAKRHERPSDDAG